MLRGVFIEAFAHIVGNTETYALLFDIIRLLIRHCVSKIVQPSVRKNELVFKKHTSA